jgi:8-oxo-dGTP pyrophosphatase MutT (NUDIX family)
MIVRHHKSDVHAGALVFPGGRVDAEDYDLAIDEAVFPAQDGVDATMAALRVAAVRETFEECGVLLARARGEEALVMTKQERAGDGMRVLRIPLEADYGGELFVVPNPPSIPSQ